MHPCFQFRLEFFSPPKRAHLQGLNAIIESSGNPPLRIPPSSRTATADDLTADAHDAHQPHADWSILSTSRQISCARNLAADKSFGSAKQGSLNPGFQRRFSKPEPVQDREVRYGEPSKAFELLKLWRNGPFQCAKRLRRRDQK